MDILAGMTDLKHAISAIEECQFDMHCIDTQVGEGDGVSPPPHDSLYLIGNVNRSQYGICGHITRP